MTGDDDWRLTWQEDYLMGIALVWHEWSEPPPGRAWRLADGSVMWSRSADAEPPARAVEEVEPKRWDHDHCDFCWAKFMDTSRFDDESREQHADILSAGYTPAPPNPRFGSAWICPTCFEDFRERFSWTVVSDDSEASG
jgi:hypothetical protein